MNIFPENDFLFRDDLFFLKACYICCKYLTMRILHKYTILIMTP